MTNKTTIYIDKFKSIIKKHNNELPKFNLIENNKFKYKNTHSWFTLQKSTINNNSIPFEILKDNLHSYPNKFDILNPTTHISIKIKLELNHIHKEIIDNWFNAYTETYNKTLEYLRNNYEFTKKDINFSTLYKNKIILIKKKYKDDKYKLYKNIDKKHQILDSYFIRSKLFQIKKDIQDKYDCTEYIKNKYNILDKKFNCKIQIHTLDFAIKQLIINIKSAVSNLKEGNIKRFRLKFWKYIRPSKTIEFEKNNFNNTILFPSMNKYIGDFKYYYKNDDIIRTNKELYNDKNNKELTEILVNQINFDHDFKINYNQIDNQYYLLIVKEPIITDKINRKPIISLDPGIKTFMTGLSQNETIKIGNNVNKKLSSYVNRLNKIENNKDIPKKIKKKNKIKINRKIKNLATDLQWKTIKLLTDNYKTIFLGNMSSKDICKKSSNILSKVQKVACLRTGFFEFQEKLKYKCSITNTKFKLINESHTSKICSNCGNYNKDLKGEHIYSCIKCSLLMDRDINACRNIYMKQYM
jgi:putative transposase